MCFFYFLAENSSKHLWALIIIYNESKCFEHQSDIKSNIKENFHKKLYHCFFFKCMEDWKCTGIQIWEVWENQPLEIYLTYYVIYASDFKRVLIFF